MAKELTDIVEGRFGQLQAVSEDIFRLIRTKEQAPEVSVVLPVYIEKDNDTKVKYLFESIDSFLNQDFDKPSELIVVDDFSGTDVVEALQGRYGPQIKEVKDKEGNVIYLGQGNIKIIKCKTNSGSDSRPRSIGYLEALKSGSKYIVPLDGDDRMRPNKIKDLYAHLESSPTTDLVHARHVSIDGDGNLITEHNDIDGWHYWVRKWIIGIDEKDPANEGKAVRHTEETIAKYRESSGNNFIHNATVMFRTNVLLRLGLDKLDTKLKYGGDYVFWREVAKVGTIDYKNTVVAEYRQHKGNLTNKDK